MKTRIFLSFALALSKTILSGQIGYIVSKGIKESTLVSKSKHYTSYDLAIDETDPVTKSTLLVKAHYFQNAKTSKLPLLIIVPPINGVSFREKRVAKHFIKRGYHVLIIEPVKNISDSTISISTFQANILSLVGAVRSAMDVMSKKSEVDSNNIFLWATSMGAIYSGIVIGVDKRINSGVFIVGGAPIADVITESKQAHIVRLRNSLMKKEKLSSGEEFRARLREAITVDPLEYAKNRPGENIYFVMATKDKIVPTKYQQLLYQSFGSPKTIKKFRKGHSGTLIRSHCFHLKDYSDFTNSRMVKP